MISSASLSPTQAQLPIIPGQNTQTNQLVEAGQSDPALTGVAVSAAHKTHGSTAVGANLQTGPAVAVVLGTAPGVATEASQANAADPTAAASGASANAGAAAGKGTAEASQPGSTQREAGQAELTDEEQKQVRELQATDRRVRAHEAAHAAAAGGLAKGGPSFTYQTGPDGRSYAVGGEVQIDTSAVSGDPAATLRKAEQIRRAALAPADPSSQDRSVAAAAAQMAAQARAEMITTEGTGGEGEPGESVEASVAPAGTETPASKNTTCPSCGGAHAGHAHEGLSAYADQSGFSPAAEQITGLFAAA